MVSVKPNHSMSISSNFNRTAGGGLDAQNVTLRSLITFAYDVRDHQLTGGPGWMDSDRYDILAKPGENDNPNGEKRSFQQDFAGIRLKLRKVLADRFQLVVHTETRELPVYMLTVGKNGPHLAESKSAGLQINNRNGLMVCRKISMQQFADHALATRLGRTVLDRTGLPGEYDFDVKYAEDRGAAAASDVSGPDFLTAMQEQLGLKIESGKGPVEVLVVDRVEKASAN